MTEYALNNKVEKHGCIMIASQSSKMNYILQKVVEDRISIGLAIQDGDKTNVIEIPIKELKLLAEDIGDIIDLYF